MLKNPYEDGRGGCWSSVGQSKGSVGLLSVPLKNKRKKYCIVKY